MRNLKRTLSLGLTATMLSGMMVAGVGAADYKDVTSENNTEAIAVLQAVGIMTGDEGGNFNPNKSVTRAEMAVIMSNMLALDITNFQISLTPFTDVPDWAGSYVAACYANGIIAGTSDTTFSPNETLTTAQAALMMMKALGYFQYASDFGASWELATVRQASKIDLFRGITAGSKDAMNRNEVAQLALNTLESTMVDGFKDFDDIPVAGGGTISTNATYTPVTSRDAKVAAAISRARLDGSTGAYSLELGERLYGGSLEKRDVRDRFNAPAKKWSYDKKEVTVVEVTPDLVYTSKVRGSAVEKDLKDLGVSVNSSDEVGIYNNGADAIIKSSFKSDDFGKSGNGVELSIYVSQDDRGNRSIESVTRREYVLEEVTKITQDKESTSADEREIRTSSGKKIKPSSIPNFENLFSRLAEGDYLMVSTNTGVSPSVIQDAYIPEKVTGKVESYVHNVGSETSHSNGVKVDGTSYKYSKSLTDNPRFLNGDDLSAGYNLNEEYALYLDRYGYVAGVKGIAAEGNYLYISSFGNRNSGLGDDSIEVIAAAVFPDGTRSTINISKVRDSKGAEISNRDLVMQPTKDEETGVVTENKNFGKWYTYSESNGNYNLNQLDQKEEAISGTYAAGDAITAHGSARVGLGSNGTAVANDSTVFVVRDRATKDSNPKINTYVGITQVPNITFGSREDSSAKVSVATDGRGFAKYVFVEITGGTVKGGNTSSTDVVYILSNDTDHSVDSNGTNVWTYKALVNGEEKALAASEKTMRKGLYYGITYDKSGYVSGATLVDKANEDFKMAATEAKTHVVDGAVEYKGNVLRILNQNGMKTFFYDHQGKTEDSLVMVPDCPIYVISGNGGYESYTGSSFAAQYDGTEGNKLTANVYVDINNDGFATAVYVGLNP